MPHCPILSWSSTFDQRWITVLTCKYCSVLLAGGLDYSFYLVVDDSVVNFSFQQTKERREAGHVSSQYGFRESVKLPGPELMSESYSLCYLQL